MAGGDHPLIDGMARAGLISPYFQLPVRRVERAQSYCSNCILTPRTQQDQLFREMLENLP